MASCAKAYQSCAGTLEIREYYVPGWNGTSPSSSGFLGTNSQRAVKNAKRINRSPVLNTSAAWPSFTRVNHAKYIVTDRRLNIGTSNWQWGYFHSTAGASLNTDDAKLVAGA